MKLITAKDFESSISKGVVLVDFSASWCGPCKMLEPVLDKISKSSDFANVSFFKVDVDSEKELVNKFSITSVPTILIFKNGNKESSFSGFLPEQKIYDFIKKYAK